jgi:hypothetical protein
METAAVNAMVVFVMAKSRGDVHVTSDRYGWLRETSVH